MCFNTAQMGDEMDVVLMFLDQKSRLKPSRGALTLGRLDRSDHAGNSLAGSQGDDGSRKCAFFGPVKNGRLVGWVIFFWCVDLCFVEYANSCLNCL